MPEPVIIAVPPKGGSLDDVLKRLVALGWIRSDVVAGIRRLVKDDKRRIKLEEGLIHFWATRGGDRAAVLRAADDAGHDLDEASAALDRMRIIHDADGVEHLGFTPKAGVDALLGDLRANGDEAVREAAMCLHLELDCARVGRPTRMMFDHLEFEWQARAGAVPVRGVLVGTEHEVTPTYLRRNKRDLSLTCYDAFHNTLLDALDTGKVHNWRELMDHLIEANTDVRILGSLGLDDYLGHFVLMPAAKAAVAMARGGGRRWGEGDDPKLAVLAEEPVLIDAQYESIYMRLLDSQERDIRFDTTREDIEEACARDGRSAIYIVRSGSTIASNPGLCVVGEELVTSETIVAVNQERLELNGNVEALVESLAPSAEDHSQRWRRKLADRLGEQLV